MDSMDGHRNISEGMVSTGLKEALDQRDAEAGAEEADVSRICRRMIWLV